MACKNVQKFLRGTMYFNSKRNEAMHLSFKFHHCSSESHEEDLPFEWYEKVFPTIKRLTHQLQNVDFVDGRLVNIKDDSIVVDGRIEQKIYTLKSLVRVFIGSPMVQQKLRENVEALLGGAKCNPIFSFSKPSEREAMIVDSLTKVSNFLNISAQQRKVVRFTICPQVTQHRIWIGALKEILNGLKSELDSLNDECSPKGSNMEQQIVSSCLKFLADADLSYDPDSTSWMRLAPTKGVDLPTSGKWEDVLEMFNDLIACLGREKGLLYHVAKLGVMKEGLSQIKDVLIDKSIGYKEARHQESLVQKKLTKTLGHSSRCLFTLLLYYLSGHIRDIEVDLCGGLYGSNDSKKFNLCMGRILTSDEEKVVYGGMKQLDRALGLFKFIWETAGMKGNMELQGHLFCVGAKGRMMTYRGNSFFIHCITL